MSLLNEDPLNLQTMLAEYRRGERPLLSYDELVQVDIQIGSQQAQIAALRQTIRTILHEQKEIAKNYFLMTRTKP